MADIVIGDIVRVAITWLYDNKSTVQQVWHYLKNAGAAEDAADLLTDIETHFEAVWALGVDDITANNLEATVMELYRWNAGTGQFDGVATETHDADGLSQGDFTAPGVAILVNLLTDVGRYQGRKYLSGVIDDSINNGAIIAASAATAGVWGVAMALPWATTGGTLQPGVFNPAAARWTAFNGNVVASLNPSYQRRRRVGTGI